MKEISWFTGIIKNNSLEFAGNRWIDRSREENSSSWSFSHEWKQYALTRQEKTWDMSARERLLHFYNETKTTPDQLPGKFVLDAGCGNGQLTLAIGGTGAYVAGIDVQSHLPGGTGHVQFVQANFDNPPFLPASFDIVIANGSIHHTRNTFHSFQSLANLVKEKGKLYVWVYKKQKGWKRFLVGCLDLARFFISRFPAPLQRFSVNILTGFFYGLSRLRKGENSNRSREEISINIYDAFTPKYRYYYSKQEISQWFATNGFKNIEVTHDNNKYGFGTLGVKRDVEH